jgi:hypothetical protein
MPRGGSQGRYALITSGRAELVKLRELLQGAKGRWDKSAPAVRTLVTLTISFCVVASVYGAYQAFSLASLVR